MQKRIGSVKYAGRIMYLWLIKNPWLLKPELQFTYRYKHLYSEDTGPLEKDAFEIGFSNFFRSSYRFGSYRKFRIVLDNIDLESLIKKLRKSELFELTKTPEEIRDLLILEVLECD